MKDTNAMLEAGKAKQWIDCFWKARPYTPDGVVGSGALSDKMREELATPKIPLPPFMHKLQKMMAGGIPLGRIVNLGSASGTGKSTIIDEMLYYWVFNSPHKIGVVSLESDSGQYGLKILSRHCGFKIELLETPEEALAFMDQEWVLKKEQELLFNEDGSHRWHIVEDRDGGVESMKSQIMKLVVECGCKVIVLDPLQDILDGLSNEEQAVFLRWMKGLIKSHGVTFINVNHVRKNGTGQKANSVGGDLHEEDFAGSSTIFKSGACNLIFSRNKEAEDPLEQNTTTMKASKIRWTGRTGVAGQYYYDLPSHTLWDLDEWLEKHGARGF
jgi:archaellum biogenesis ATPase FlaH